MAGHNGTLDDTGLWNAADGIGTTTKSLGPFGTNDEVSFGDHADFKNFGSFTIRFFGKITNKDTYGTLFRKMHGSDGSKHAFYLDYYDFAPFNKAFVLAIYTPPTASNVLAQYTSGLNPVNNELFYFGVSWNNTTRTLLFYKANASAKGLLSKNIYSPSGAYYTSATDWGSGVEINSSGDQPLIYGNADAGDSPFPAKSNRLALDKNYAFTEAEFLVDATSFGF